MCDFIKYLKDHKSDFCLNSRPLFKKFSKMGKGGEREKIGVSNDLKIIEEGEDKSRIFGVSFIRKSINIIFVLSLISITNHIGFYYDLNFKFRFIQITVSD